MASVLSAYPVVNGARIPSNGSTGVNGRAMGIQHQAPFPNNVPPFGMMANASIPSQSTGARLPGFQPGMQMNVPFMSSNPPVYSPNMAVQLQMGSYGYPFATQQQIPGMGLGMGPPLNPKQRDGIERWRQSVA